MNSEKPIRYVLVTAAHNEEKLIEQVLQSVVSQTVLPLRWVVVSDASTDQTDAIVQRYASKYPFIQLLRREKSHKRNFGAQVHAINEGVKQLQALPYDYIGNLDADVSFDATYFAELIRRFEEDPKLGLAGGFITEESEGEFRNRKRNSIESIAHAVQLFRRECFGAIGGYVPLPYGGPDWHAGVSARMKGWHIRSFPELGVRHHRPTGTADSWQRDCFRQGCMDFSLGSHPVFELFKCARRLRDKPAVAGATVRLAGFVWCYCTGKKPEVSAEFMKFLRKEQMSRVWSQLAPWRLQAEKPVEPLFPI
jgi:hypothetical protein